MMESDDFEFRADRTIYGINKVSGYKALADLSHYNPLREEGNRQATKIMNMVTQGMLRWIFSQPSQVQTAFFEELWIKYHVEDNGETMAEFAHKLWYAMDATNWIQSIDCDSPSDRLWSMSIDGLFYEVFQRDRDEDGNWIK